MKRLQVNLFCMSSKRQPFAFKNVNELLRLFRSDVKIVLYLTEDNLGFWKERLGQYKGPTPIEFTVFPNHDYCSKVREAHKTDYEYSCKLDDDVLISRYTWEFMIENLDKLGESNPIMAPILTNGMNSVEFFIKDFLTTRKYEEAKNLFLSGRVKPDVWRLDFRGVNDFISTMSEWDGEAYWNFVSQYDNGWKKIGKPPRWTVVLGVHPARFSYEYNMFIANEVIKNAGKFYSKQNYSLNEFVTPYFTNNMFCAKTQYWIDTFNMFHDGWDEGQLTVAMRETDSKPYYVRNGFGIHMAYGCTQRASEIEDYYINNMP